MIETIVAQRSFNCAYIWLDIVFLTVFAILLIVKKRYLTFLWSIFGGILYFIVDYGIFYLATHSRSVYIDGVLAGAAGTALVLLWMSMSYGMTNFAWIWLALSKDEYLKEWTLMLALWWIAAPMAARMFPDSAGVSTIRTTGEYHGIMGIILIVSYLAVIAFNMLVKDKRLKIRVLWLCAIGVLVQFGWEAALLIGEIRSSGLDITFEQKLRTLVVNSLVETNLGMPIIFLIFLWITSNVMEDLKKNNSNIKEQLLLANEGRGKLWRR